jgi:hypothetical protein
LSKISKIASRRVYPGGLHNRVKSVVIEEVTNSFSTRKKAGTNPAARKTNMMRRNTIPFCLLMFVLIAGGPRLLRAETTGQNSTSKPSVTTQPALASSKTGVITTKVINVSTEQGIVGLEGGSLQGVTVGDDFWVLSDSGVAGWGGVFVVTTDRCAGRVASISSSKPANIVAGQKAVVLRHAMLTELRDRLPPGASIRGKIVRPAPGRLTAWIDINADSGLQMGDQVIVSRKGVPLSRGRISLLDRNTALTTLEPVVGNALPEPGDAVELWPSPSDAHWGRLTTTVMQVAETIDGPTKGAQISIVGSAADGVTIERLVDVYRGRNYIGVASVAEVSSPNSKANMIGPASLIQDDPNKKRAENWPAEGDLAIVRSAPDSPPGPMLVAVFQIEKDYCLLAAGEADGIKVGETFLVRRQDANDPMVWHDIAMLTVKKVEAVYLGAQVKPLTSQAAGLKVWDMAERLTPGVEQWRAVGIVESAEPASRTAVSAVDPGCSVAVGDVVGWIPEGESPPGGAIVIQRDADRLVLHIPPGWGEMSAVPRARIDTMQRSQ